MRVSERKNLGNLAAYLEGPAIAPVGTLTLRAGLAHVPIGPNFSSLQHSTHNIGWFVWMTPFIITNQKTHTLRAGFCNKKIAVLRAVLI